MEDETGHASATESVTSEVEAPPESLPPWAIWPLWIMVVAALVVSLAEWPKRLWFKPTKAWQGCTRATQKAGLLAPLLVILGAGIGGPLFHAAGMLQTWLLCFGLGAGVGILSAPLYTATLGVIALIPKIVQEQLIDDADEQEPDEEVEDGDQDGETDDEYVPRD